MESWRKLGLRAQEGQVVSQAAAAAGVARPCARAFEARAPLRERRRALSW